MKTIRVHEGDRFCGHCGSAKVYWPITLCNERRKKIVPIESLAPDVETMKSLKEIREQVDLSCRQRVDRSLPGTNEYFQYVALAALIDIAASLRFFAEMTEEDRKEDEEGRE